MINDYVKSVIDSHNKHVSTGSKTSLYIEDLNLYFCSLAAKNNIKYERCMAFNYSALTCLIARFRNFYETVILVSIVSTIIEEIKAVE